MNSDIFHKVKEELSKLVNNEYWNDDNINVLIETTIRIALEEKKKKLIDMDKYITMNKNLQMIVDKFGISQSSRQRNLVYQRQEFVKFCTEELNLTSTYIGRFLNRDHSTVLYSLNQGRMFHNLNDEIYLNTTRDIRNDLNQLFTL